MNFKKIFKNLLERNLSENSWNYIIQQSYLNNIARNNKELSELLKGNVKYKNMHKGKRCFILGNGPSLHYHDLSLLENEIVFTCNQISRNPEFKKIKTNYHFWADPIFFNLDENKPEDMELLDTMKNVITDHNNPQCFFSIDAFNLVRKYNLNHTLNISYYCSGLKLYKNFCEDIDFAKMVPGFHTVVQYQILLAIYMGFKEIYVLGSEFTGILTSINIRLQNNLSNDYAYELTKNEMQRMNNRVNKVTFEQELNSFYHVVRDYRILNEYCQKRNIKLINCTPGGLIESLPRKKYEDLFNKEVN